MHFQGMKNSRGESPCYDDSSHDKEDRKQRDKFVDFILKDVGIPTIRKRGIIGTELENEIAQLTKSVSFTAR